MKKHITRLSGFIALLAGCAVLAARAADLNALTDAEKADGWKLLFDGKETTGWRAYAQADFPKEGWVVEDGCLKNEHGVHGGDLVTTQQFTDFDLKFEWRISPAGNSGVKYLVKEGKSGKAGVGFEYQVLDDQQNEDAQNGPNRQAGALYALIAPNESKRLKPVGEFNQSEILVRGNHVEHWLNGAKIVECELGSPTLKEAIAKSKFAKITWFGQKRPSVILLQDHGDTVWFRNLKIKELKPD
jgi:3-keto-disaccharide hydrolase